MCLGKGDIEDKRMRWAPKRGKIRMGGAGHLCDCPTQTTPLLDALT